MSAQEHESAVKHVTGTALYVDDMPETRDQLHVATGQSTFAHGRLVSLDLSSVRRAPGVVDVITFADIPGSGDVSPVHHGDLLLADGEVNYVGQPLFAVAATSQRLAKQACALAIVEIEGLDPVLSIQSALDADSFVLPTRTFQTGDAATAIASADHVLESEMYVRGQEHFYLEGQVCLATPDEDGGVHVISSSQHPTEVQRLVASVLGLDINCVHAEVRRMGGGFGGTEAQAAAGAWTAAGFAV